jgi:hypothetical protein
MLSVKCMVAGALAAFFTTATAQQGPCADDLAKYCKDVQPGEGRILECLKTNKTSLSTKCSAYLQRVVQVAKDACKPDVERFCMDAPMGKGGLAKCLKKHEADLTPQCKEVIAKAKAKAAAQH